MIVLVHEDAADEDDEEEPFKDCISISCCTAVAQMARAASGPKDPPAIP